MPVAPSPSWGPAPPWRRWAQITLAIVAVLACLSLLLSPNPVRAGLTLVAVLLVPGAAITGFTRFSEAITEAMVAVAASITVTVFTGQLMLWFHAWHPEPVFVVLSMVSAAVLARHARGGRDTSREPVVVAALVPDVATLPAMEDDR